MSHLRNNSSDNDSFPCRVVIVAGTYDGVLVGWDTEGQEEEIEEGEKNKVSLKMSFAFTAHEGSVRSICIANNKNTSKNCEQQQPGQVVSAGYLDESLVLLDLLKHQQVGEAKLPMELGTPTCLSFAPPYSAPTHALVGTSSGKIAIYSLGDGDDVDDYANPAKKRSKKKQSNPWNIVHILSGHSSTSTSTTAGVSCIATHPTGKLALSSGNRDSTICVWDLMKGRLAHVHKLNSSSKNSTNKVDVTNLVWSKDGRYFSFSYDSCICVRHATTGQDLLDVDLNSSSNSRRAKRVNDMCFLPSSSSWLFLAAVCDDGSLPVFCIDTTISSSSPLHLVRAIMAIHGVDRIVVGTDRLKFIRSLSNFFVVTANTGGVVSIIDLAGAVSILLSDVAAENETAKTTDDGDEEESAAEILTSVRVGSGARITNIAAWCCHNNSRQDGKQVVEQQLDPSEPKDISAGDEGNMAATTNNEDLTIRARKLVQQAKKRQRRENLKNRKKL
jgi:WD40 repeat protein